MGYTGFIYVALGYIGISIGGSLFGIGSSISLRFMSILWLLILVVKVSISGILGSVYPAVSQL